jgi:hypothetical protein
MERAEEVAIYCKSLGDFSRAGLRHTAVHAAARRRATVGVLQDRLDRRHDGRSMTEGVGATPG